MIFLPLALHFQHLVLRPYGGAGAGWPGARLVRQNAASGMGDGVRTGLGTLDVGRVAGDLRRPVGGALGGNTCRAKGPALIASMHQSAFDTMVWILLVPRACYVLKRELVAIPVFGPMCRLTGMIAVDRGAGAAAIRSLLKECDRAVAEDDRQMVIFPEGTRVPPGNIVELQPGVAAMASRTKLPVLPVVTDSGRCWGRRAFRKRPGVIHVRIGPPLPGGMARPALMGALAGGFLEQPRGRSVRDEHVVWTSLGEVCAAASAALAKN